MARRRWRAVRAVTAAAALLVTLACSSPGDPGPSSGGPPPMPASGTGTVQIGGRPVTVHVPGSYDPARPAPLVVGLHGYSSHAQEMESYLQLTPESERKGFIYAYPDGLADDHGKRFWNATDACCAFTGRQPDDSRYLSELLSTMQSSYRIDPARVHLIGHSNGGFMAFRMACDHAGQVASIVSLNGATWHDAARCKPSEPVSVLVVHSSDDETIRYAGGANAGVSYPSVDDTVGQWRTFNQCADAGRDAAELDLITDVPAAETSVRTYATGCAGGSTVQLWTIEGGRHVPGMGPGFAPAVTDFMLAQAKPGG